AEDCRVREDSEGVAGGYDTCAVGLPCGDAGLACGVELEPDKEGDVRGAGGGLSGATDECEFGNRRTDLALPARLARHDAAQRKRDANRRSRDSRSAAGVLAIALAARHH